MKVKQGRLHTAARFTIVAGRRKGQTWEYRLKQPNAAEEFYKDNDGNDWFEEKHLKWA